MTGSPLLSLESALDALLSQVEVVAGSESVHLAAAQGRVLAADIEARLDAPRWDNSAMDGFALRSRDAGREIPVRGRVAAGDAPTVLPEASAVRIFTGAPLPEGADVVVMQEQARWTPGAAAEPQSSPGASGTGAASGSDALSGSVFVDAPQTPGQHIRRQGEECRRGETLLRAGRRLRPQDLGLIASQGIDAVTVKPPLRVALLSTGSELRETGSGELPPGGIYNSNRPMLAAMLAALGCVVVDRGLVDDTPAATRAALEGAAEGADLIVTTGGVSVGEPDHVRDAVAALGSLDLWRVAVKPGKPFAFGEVRGVPFMGLPGNPASAFVTFALLARPWLCARQGRSDGSVPRLAARADFDLERPGTRDEYLRVRLVSGGAPTADPTGHGGGPAGQDAQSVDARRTRPWARPYGRQSSGILRSVVDSDALACVPAGTTVRRGDELEILLLDALLA